MPIYATDVSLADISSSMPKIHTVPTITTAAAAEFGCLSPDIPSVQVANASTAMCVFSNEVRVYLPGNPATVSHMSHLPCNYL